MATVPPPPDWEEPGEPPGFEPPPAQPDEAEPPGFEPPQPDRIEPDRGAPEDAMSGQAGRVRTGFLRGRRVAARAVSARATSNFTSKKLSGEIETELIARSTGNFANAGQAWGGRAGRARSSDWPSSKSPACGQGLLRRFTNSRSSCAS